MITSYADFVAGLAALVVPGVRRRLPHPPSQIGTGDLPLQFVRLPEGEEGALTADGGGGWPRLASELVIVVSPTHQGKAQSNYAGTVALIDALSETLRNVPPGQLCKSKIAWSVRGTQGYLGGDTEYWLVVARVTGNG